MTTELLEDYADQSWAYEVFSPNGKPHIVCPQCRGLVLLFEELTVKEKREIAELLCSSGAVKAMDSLKQLSGCDIRQAKANILHIRHVNSHCHKCATDVPPGALLCSRCMSVNLDW